ncbi:MAG TPA: hypothetical protein VL287_16765 [Gemmatimonadales bacterium]|jgi:hypothetical protein|nr:hypothetical protein [Gemmatimonadales bacterium]
MTAKILAGGIAATLALIAGPLRAQTTVEGGVAVQSGPVRAHVEVGTPPPAVVYAEPAREVIVVEPVHVPNGRAHGWWKKHGYREVTVFYDGDRYYSHRVRVSHALREVVIYERGGKYYQWRDGAERHEEHNHGHGHGHD